MTRPDVTRPDVTRPDVTRPDVTRPDVTRPDVARPDVARPDVARQAVHCVARVAGLLRRRQLHLHRDHIGDVVRTADDRRFTIYRESSSSEPCGGEPIWMAMWFHLRWVPAGARVRAFLFERESILNTMLYAGFEGYRTKLWTFDHETNDYAGFYTWRGREAAERYAAYAMKMLRPLSVPGSLGFEISTDPSDMRWSTATRAARAPADATAR